MTDYLKFRIDHDSGELFATQATLDLMEEMSNRGDLWDMDILGDLFKYAESYYSECNLNYSASNIVRRAKFQNKTIEEVRQDEAGYPCPEAYDRAKEQLDASETYC